MDKVIEEFESYEEPRIEDIGTLAELTASKDLSGGDFTVFLGTPS